jgi:hypothetical protein
MDVKDAYVGRIRREQARVDQLKKIKKYCGLGRLFSFLGAIILFFAFLDTDGSMAAALAILMLLIFLAVALKDMKNSRRLHHHETLLRINEEELEALEQRYPDLQADGFRPPEDHPYANDLDIFGNHSLFRFIDRTTSAPASALLALRLMQPASMDKINLWQDASRELRDEIDWRQELQARGRRAKLSRQADRQIRHWASTGSGDALGAPAWIIFTLPAVTLALAIAAYQGWTSWRILWLPFWAHLGVMWWTGKKVIPVYNALSQAINPLEAFRINLEALLSKSFAAPHLQDLQQRCRIGDQRADKALKALGKILDGMDLRLNPLVYLPLNFVIFLDWRLHRRLLRWKSLYGEALPTWLDALAETEVLCCFANTAFNHPDWCFPQIIDGPFHFSATDLGHPLLPEAKRVCNDITIEGRKKILLITGSNMAGKSTFLRTVGVNMVLAMAGGPVCARKLAMPELLVLSSMRIADNLEENISTFYAELKKLETIIKRVRAHEPVFLLLDEILRGTNSQDRHAGAVALIRQLLAEEAVGILATHDLALTDIAGESQGQVLNYHFDVQVKGEELFFDYRLKPGVCTSMNATLLMRKIGIHL